MRRGACQRGDGRRRSRFVGGSTRRTRDVSMLASDGLSVLIALYLSKMDLVEDDLVGVPYAVEACDKCQYGDNHQRKSVVPI